MNSIQESDYSTEENKKRFIWESFKIDEMRITFATNLKRDQAEIVKEKQKFTAYQPAIHSVSQEKHWDQE